MGRAQYLQATMLWGVGRSLEAAETAAAAVRTLEPLGPSQALADAYSAVAIFAMLSRDHEEALAWGERAVALASEVEAPSALSRGLNSIGSTKLLRGESSGRQDLLRSIEIASRHGMDRAVAGGWSNLGSGAGEVRDHAMAEPALRQAVAFATAHDLDAQEHYATAWLARVRFELGAWEEATDLVARLPVADERIVPATRIVALTVRGRLAVRRGSSTAGEQDLATAWVLAERTGDLQRTWPVVAGLTELAWLRGDPAAVPPALGQVYAEALRHEHPWAIGELALWLSRMERSELSSAPPVPAAEPYTHHLAGRLEEAAASWLALGCPYETADALSDSDDPAQLRRALTMLDELGATLPAARVRRRLRERGAHDIPRGPQRVTAGHPAGLTGRQQEVLELLALGLTDGDLAERLHLSRKTVGHHVSAILAKLQVASRGEAVHMARTRGFLRDDPADPFDGRM